ncbi:MAG TPA: serine dehydratase beta chain, partial [Streptosporangiaceae bacterium]
MSQPAELGPPEIAAGAGAPPGTMAISVFDLFKIGIGPSSSHTVGPMRAAAMFVASLESAGLLAKVASIRAELFGSLGATGHGHGSMPAVVLGLRGEHPETVDPAATSAVVDRVRESGKLTLGEAAGPASKEIDFDVDEDVVLHRRKRLPFHSNAMVFVAADAHGGELSRRTYYSVGGGFVLDEDQADGPRLVPDSVPVPYPFASGADLLARAKESGLPISGVMLENELARRRKDEIAAGLTRIWSVMQECVEAGSHASGVLPGGLKVRRRAPGLREKLEHAADVTDPLYAMEWVTLY